VHPALEQIGSESNWRFEESVGIGPLETPTKALEPFVLVAAESSGEELE